MKIALKRTYEKKYVTKMKKRISHTQSTTNYCLISSTFQKSFKKKTFHCKFGKKMTQKMFYI